MQQSKQIKIKGHRCLQTKTETKNNLQFYGLEDQQDKIREKGINLIEVSLVLITN